MVHKQINNNATATNKRSTANDTEAGGGKLRNNNNNNNNTNATMDLAFSGAGFMGCYYFGVVDGWKKYIPRDRVNRAAGASAGSLIAAYYLMDLPLGPCLREIIGLTEEFRSRALGVFDRSHQMVDVLPKLLDRLFPDDSHKRLSGKLHVCITRLKDMKKVIVSEFDTKKDLLDALNCSCFIPVWSGNHVSTYKGEKYIDGGFSDNLPVFDENTIRICCFAGQTDISPYDKSQKEMLSSNISNTPLYLTMANLRRGAMALWPPPPPAVLDMLERGLQDAKRFILDNDLIQCDKCYLRLKAADQGLHFDRPNPTISPAASPTPSRRAPGLNCSSSMTTASSTTSSLHTAVSQLLAADDATLRASHSASSLRQQSPDGSATNDYLVPKIFIQHCRDASVVDENNNERSMTPTATQATNKENSHGSSVDESGRKIDKLSRQVKKMKSRYSIDGGIANSSAITTLRERRRSQAQLLNLSNNLSASSIPDSFKLAPNELPSCPPSPNLNRHCNECLRLRQVARNDRLEETMREVAESFLDPIQHKGGIRRKLSSPLRWIKTQLKQTYTYEFANQQQQQEQLPPLEPR